MTHPLSSIVRPNDEEDHVLVCGRRIPRELFMRMVRPSGMQWFRVVDSGHHTDRSRRSRSASDIVIEERGGDIWDQARVDAYVGRTHAVLLKEKETLAGTVRDLRLELRALRTRVRRAYKLRDAIDKFIEGEEGST